LSHFIAFVKHEDPSRNQFSRAEVQQAITSYVRDHPDLKHSVTDDKGKNRGGFKIEGELKTLFAAIKQEMLNRGINNAKDEENLKLLDNPYLLYSDIFKYASYCFVPAPKKEKATKA
jgi:hypothetical protein